MRVCIYKTDNAPDLTLFLHEGMAIPSEERDQNWVPLKTVTPGELRADISSRMEKTGCCVERLGRAASTAGRPTSPTVTKRISLRWLGFPKSLKI